MKLAGLAKAHFSPDIRPAELRVIRDSVREGPAKTYLSESPTDRRVRGQFLRWILSDPATSSCFDKDGLQVVSATIDGDVDLDSAAVSHDIRFDGCTFTEGVHFVNAALRNVTISNSTIQGNVSFQNAAVNGDIVLSPKVTAHGFVSTYGAQVSGDVNIVGATLVARKGDKNQSLSLNEADITGCLYLTDLSCEVPVFIYFARLGNFIADGATFESTVNMNGTTIRESLSLVGAKCFLLKTTESPFSDADTPAVDLQRMSVGDSIYLSGTNLRGEPISLAMRDTTVAGSVYVTGTLQASGKLDMGGVRIKQALYILQSTLTELDAHQAEIGALFVLESKLGNFDISASKIGQFEWAGIVDPRGTTLNLTRTHVGTFRDDQNSWPLAGRLQIIGLVYDDIELEVPRSRRKIGAPSEDDGTNPDDRIAWLRLQSKEDIVASQPWMQLAQYVQSSGNLAGARRVLYDMKRIQASNEGRMREWKSFVPDYLDENPWRVTYFTGAFWGIGSLVFWRARRMNLKLMAPREKAAYEEFSKGGTLPENVPPFNPVVYALENVLPVVKFGQDDAWGPNPAFNAARPIGWKRWLPHYSYSWLAFARLLLITLGWALAIILAGVIGGLFKS